MTNFSDDYQYDSCVSRGICSVDPRTSSLQEILVLYLRVSAYYALKTKQSGNINEKIKHLILSTISIMVSNPKFSENDFKTISEKFNEELPVLIEKYEEMCKESDIEPDYIKSVLKYDKSTDIIKSIQIGEKEYLKKAQLILPEVRDMYKILFVLAKSLCINMLDLESFGISDGYEVILKLLNSLNFENETVEVLKELTEEVTKFDNKLMKTLNAVKEERYGIQRPKEVSYTTTPSKAVLVVGSNIRELEIIAEALKDTNIDIYTHDEMMLAHTYPKFDEYKNLKGQFGQGMESCLLDFATFPGPIILTKHSLYNVDNLYRGRLYTTDVAYSKGVISIQNYDFSDVIQSANEAKGFKKGKVCSNEIVGFDYNEASDLFKKEIKTKKYSKIFVIGLNGYTKEEKEYFETFLNLVPDDVLVVSLSSCVKKDNVICLNACFDSYAMLKISENILEKYNQDIVLFFPKCDRNTISKMIYLSALKKAQIYVGKCTPISLNPNLVYTLKKVYGIKNLTSPKKDLQEILGKK